MLAKAEPVAGSSLAYVTPGTKGGFSIAVASTCLAALEAASDVG